MQRWRSRACVAVTDDDDEAVTLRSTRSFEDAKDIEMQDLGGAGAKPHRPHQQQKSSKMHRKNQSSGGGSLRSKLVNPVSTLKHAGTYYNTEKLHVTRRWSTFHRAGTEGMSRAPEHSGFTIA